MKANAASRLVSVLEDLTRQNSSSTMGEVWAGVLQVKKEDTIDILTGLASILQLLGEAKETVQATVGEANLKLHMGAFHKLEAAFSSINLQANGNTLVQQVGEALQGLRFSADLVERVGDGGLVDEELIATLIEEVNQQVAVLMDSDLSEQVKAVLHERLTAVREAAERIRLFGVEQFEAAVDAMVGATVRHKPDTEKPSQKKVLDGIIKVVDLAAKVIALAQKLPELPGLARKLLGAGS